MLFGAHQYIQRNNANSSYFDGPTDWNAADGLEKRRSASTLTGFDYDKHNFVTFDLFFSSSEPSSHRLTVMCKIIPRTEQP